MPNTTYGTPYAQSSDLVSNWPGVSLNVADRIDDISFKGNGLNDQTGTSYTLVLTDAGKTVTLNNAAAVTVTIPTNASVAYETGTEITLTNKGAGAVTVSPAATVTLNNSTTLAQNSTATIQKLDTNTWVMISAPAPGLTFITSASLSGSSVSVNSCFSATYNVYRIVITGAYTAADLPSLYIRLRASGSDAATNYQYQHVYFASTSTAPARATSQTSLLLSTIADSAQSTPVLLDVFNVFASGNTSFLWHAGYYLDKATPVFYVGGGAHVTASSYDGFTLFPSSSTFSGGTVRVYGYRNS